MQHGGPKEHPTGKTIQVTNDLLYPPSSDTPQHTGRQQAEEKGDEKYDEKPSEFVAN